MGNIEWQNYERPRGAQGHVPPEKYLIYGARNRDFLHDTSFFRVLQYFVYADSLDLTNCLPQVPRPYVVVLTSVHCFKTLCTKLSWSTVSTRLASLLQMCISVHCMLKITQWQRVSLFA